MRISCGDNAQSSTGKIVSKSVLAKERLRLAESFIDGRRHEAHAGNRKDHRVRLHGPGLAMSLINAWSRRKTVAYLGFEEALSWRFSCAEVFSWSLWVLRKTADDPRDYPAHLQASPSTETKSSPSRHSSKSFQACCQYIA
jgi:hypothetical protein